MRLHAFNGTKHVQIHGQSRDRALQGSAITQTVLGGLTIYPTAANFL